MAILDFLKPKPKTKPILTSRPIFQFSSSFINDDNDNDLDLKKPTPPLPLFHQRNMTAPHLQHDVEDLEVVQPKPHSRLLLILHILNTIFSLVSLTLFITTIPIWDANFQHTRSLISGDYTDGLVLVPLFLSLFASTLILLTEHTKLGKQLQFRFKFTPKASSTTNSQLKPRTLVLLCFTVLVLLVSTLTFSATNSLALAWRAPQRTKDGSIICNLANIMTKQCQPVLYQIGSLQIAAIVTGGVSWGVWAIMFVLSVRDWMRERKEQQRQAARERRRRRHERKRANGHREGGSNHGDGHSNSQRHRHQHRRRHEHGSGKNQRSVRREGSHASRENHSASETRDDLQTSQRTQHTHGARDHIQAPTLHQGLKDVAKPSEAHIGSPAAQLASHKVRPKETIQVWLNGRYTQR